MAPAPVRRELVEDLTDRTVARCVPLLARDDVPEHVRALTSREVLDVEADLLARLTARAEQPATQQLGSAPWSHGVTSTTPNARSSPHSVAPHSCW